MRPLLELRTVIELNASLNMDYEISKNLKVYMILWWKKLVDGNIKKEVKPLDEALEPLTDLRDTWKEAIKQVKKLDIVLSRCVNGKNLVDELIRISNEKLKLLNVILDLTKLEREYIDKEDMNKINGALDEKDNVICRIEKLDIEFLTCFSQLKKENNISELDELI